MEINDYCSVWFEDSSGEKIVGIIRVDQVNGSALTKVGFFTNWRKIPNNRKGLGFPVSEAIVADYKQAAIENLKKKIEAVEKF